MRAATAYLSSAFTFGVMSDHDARLARIVAASLSLDAHLFEVPQRDFSDCARLAARWEHSQNGFSSLYHWKLIEPLARFGSLVANGLVMDAVVGGSHIRWAYHPGRRSMSFDAFWRHLNRHGLPPLKVRDMARSAEVRDAVDQVHREAEGVFDSLGETVAHRAYAFDLRYRQRFHVARGAWVTSLGSWPIMPILDRDLLAVAGGIPPASLGDRRCESIYPDARVSTLGGDPVGSQWADGRSPPTLPPPDRPPSSRQSDLVRWTGRTVCSLFSRATTVRAGLRCQQRCLARHPAACGTLPRTAS